MTGKSSMFFHLLLIIAVVLNISTVFADEPLSAIEDPGADQSDIYYTAMIRSIDLDKTRWKAFGRSMESGPWFYDTQSLKRKGIMVTTMVTVFPHPEKTEIYSSVYHDHTKIRKIVFDTEINCKMLTYRQPHIRVYGYYNELLTEHSNDKNLDFSPIRQGTTTDTLRSLVCESGRKKKKR
jgi:hypothetical protein